jgi:hypothetical protein
MVLASLRHNASQEARETPLDPDKVADQIEAAGMRGLAVVLLHAFKPLAWMGGQMAWVLQPFLEGPGPNKRSPLSISGLANLLESEQGVDNLLDRLTRNPKPEAENQKQ